MAGEGDAERLVVLLEARIKDFEKNMAKASGTATKSYAGMRRDSAAATVKMEADMIRSTNSINRALAATSSKIGGFGLSISKGAVAALAPLIGLTAAINGAKAALSEFGDIADNSKAAGIDAEMFQGLAQQAQLGGVGIDTLSTALAGFNRNSGLAVENKGRMVTALKALNPELLKNIQAATSQEERIKLAADAIAKESDEAKKAALSVALFGDAGAKLADVFSGGAAGIAEASAKARELGLIIDNDLIARADEMGDEFDTATKVMDLQFKQTLIELAPILISTAKLAGDLAAGINYLSQSMQEMGKRSTARLRQDYDSLSATLETANAQYAPGVQGADAMGISIDPAKKAEMEKQRSDIFAELTRRKASEMAASRLAPDVGGDDGGATASGNAAANAAIKQADAVKSLIADLEFERSLIGKSAVEQAKMNALRQAGAAATGEQQIKIGELVEATFTEQDRIDALQASFDLLGDMGKTAIQGIVGALEDGQITAEEFGDILSDVLSKAAEFFLNQAFSSFGGGGGGGGGFNIGKFFGFADGTANTGGQRGEPRGVVHGQEAVIPLPAGGKVPVQIEQSSQTGPAASSSSTIRLIMPEGWQAEILDQAGSHAVQIVQENDRAQRNYRQNGGM